MHFSRIKTRNRDLNQTNIIIIENIIKLILLLRVLGLFLNHKLLYKTHFNIIKVKVTKYIITIHFIIELT